MTTLLLLAAFSCGNQRLAVKTLHDPEAKKISYKIKEPFIGELLGLPAPPFKAKGKRLPAETQIIRMVGYIIGYMEEEDGDYHVVFQPAEYYLDTPEAGNTMILEFPAPVCLRKAYWEGRMLRALQQFEQMVPQLPTKTYYELPERIHVEVEGIPFFDKKHGQRGVAINGLELHPVLAIRRMDDY